MRSINAMYSFMPITVSPSWNPGPPRRSLERMTGPSPPASPPPSRLSRLRRLSSLRTYTKLNILSRDRRSRGSWSSSGSTSVPDPQHWDPSSVTATGTGTGTGTAPPPSTGLVVAATTSTPAPTSEPAPSPASAALSAPATQQIHQQTYLALTGQSATSTDPPANSSPQYTSSSPNGWLPTIDRHPQTSVSRVGNDLNPQSAATASPSLSVEATPRAAELAEMPRTRSATAAGVSTDMPAVDGAAESQTAAGLAQNGAGNGKGMSHQLPSIRFTAHQDPRATRPSLTFNPMARILPSGNEVIKVGRYSERDTQPAQAPNVPSAAPIGFKSKVVSRRHCEFWCASGRWFIRDVKSSSGTFLNHIRLSLPGTESKPYPVNDGDIVQLGIDFKGGEDMIFRCVKIRIELNKGWQNGPSSFNVQSHKRLRELNSLGKPPTSGSSQDCSICLGPIAPCQSLFVAPCSHTWHYKCIRVIINGPHWPHFVCPNCRSVADLEAELDDPFVDGEWEEQKAVDAAPVPPEASEPPNSAADLPQEPNITDATALLVQTITDNSGPGGRSDVEEASHGSQTSQGIDHDMEVLNVEESPSPSNSTDSQLPQVSNSTVAPVDIISRRPVANHVPSPSARLDQPGTHRSTTRTPSPNGMSDSLDVTTGTEGPMTPRNDAGPFIFDGSGGRPSDVRTAAVATMNLNAAADTPPPCLTPQATT